jgi:uncharacterized membrane protein
MKGRHMPFCARCLGASIGHLSCAVCYFIFALPVFYFSLLGLAVLYADWYSQNTLKLYHSNLMRLVTGIAGGFGMGIIIWKVVDLIIKFLGGV